MKAALAAGKQLLLFSRGWDGLAQPESPVLTSGGKAGADDRGKESCEASGVLIVALGLLDGPCRLRDALRTLEELKGKHEQAAKSPGISDRVVVCPCAQRPPGVWSPIAGAPFPGLV